MSDEQILRWGILGAARINQQLMPAIVSAKDSQLVAIASQRPEAAEKTLAQYAPNYKGAVRIYSRREDLLNDQNIDAVYIPLENKSHAEWVLRAIEKGKHVLCEKPLALAVDDIEAIEVAAKKHKVLVMEGFMYQFHPQHAHIQAIIESGAIGEIRSVRTCFSFMMQAARQYRLSENIENGGGAMWDIGCYAIHTARRMFKTPPLAVTAMATHTKTGADVSCSGIIDYGNGKFAQFDFSFERARRAEYEIIGTKGGIKCHNVWAKSAETPIISWWTEQGDTKEESLPQHNHFRLEVESFIQCVFNQTSPNDFFEDAKMNCRVIRAALKSVTSNQKITL
jgi:predicted dehydrogenase